MEIRQLKRWLLLNFPDTAASYLYPEPGYILQPVGEALLVQACEKIEDYVIHFNNTFNNTCYTALPVTSTRFTGVYFLELNTRRISSHAQKIPCEKVRKMTFVTDIKGKVWKFQSNAFSIVKRNKYNIPEKRHHMIKIAGFNPRLIHYEEKIPSRISLLHVLAHNKENLDSLQSYKEEGDGSISTGIGRVLGKTISSLASGSSLIIKTIGLSIHDALHGIGDLDEVVVGSIGNATSQVVTSTTTGFAKMLDAIGGLPSFILWIIVLLIIIYLTITGIPGLNLSLSPPKTPFSQPNTAAPLINGDAETNNDGPRKGKTETNLFYHPEIRPPAEGAIPKTKSNWR